MSIEPTHYDPGSDRTRGRRLEHQLRRLGDRNPVCSHPACAECDPTALTGTAPDQVRCYEHQAVSVGRDWVEDHHLLGRANDPATTARVPGNDHRVLSDLQHEWPRETLRNLEASPLIRAAAAIRGWLDVLWVILTRAVAWVPAFLERLDAVLTERHGTGWWRTLGVEATP